MPSVLCGLKIMKRSIVFSILLASTVCQIVSCSTSRVAAPSDTAQDSTRSLPADVRRLLIDCNHAFRYAERVDAQNDSLITLTHDVPVRLSRERNRGRIEGAVGLCGVILVFKLLSP